MLNTGTKKPLWEKALKTLMKSAVQKSNVDKNKKLTNYSGRKTAVTRLLEEGLPLTSIQQHTGHKNISSINNYAVNSVKTQKKMSAILSKSSKPHTCTSEELSKHSKTESSESDSVQKAASATVEQIPCNNPQPETTQKSSESTSTLNSASGPLNFSHFFPAGTVIQEGMFNFYFGKKSPISCDKENKSPLPLKKRRQFVIDSDSD
jgi:hypothetical protein